MYNYKWLYVGTTCAVMDVQEINSHNEGTKEMNQTKWIELIRVRSSAEILQEALTMLTIQINDIEKEAHDAETFVMQHALYDGDLAVVIVWHSDVLPKKTREGLMVAEQMKELGSIEHAVWIPAPKEQ